MLIYSIKGICVQFLPKPVVWPKILLEKQRGEGGKEKGIDVRR